VTNARGCLARSIGKLHTGHFSVQGYLDLLHGYTVNEVNGDLDAFLAEAFQRGLEMRQGHPWPGPAFGEGTGAEGRGRPTAGGTVPETGHRLRQRAAV